MKNINKIILLSTLTSSIVFSSEISIDSVGFNLGVSNTPYSQENPKGSITLGNTPDKQLNSYEVYTNLKSVYTNKTLKPYMSYTYSYNKDIKNQYILIGLSKYYTHKELKLYAGLLTGYGELKYKYNPLNSSKDNDYKANSLILGVQTGVNLPLSPSIALNVNAKYLYHDYKTSLEPNDTTKASITYKYTSSLGVGLLYKF